MAMTFDTITPVLTEFYVPGIEPYVYSEDAVTTILKARERVQNVGYEFDVRVQTGFSEGVGMMASAAAALPTARQNQFKRYQGTPRTIAARIRLYNTLLDYLKNDPNKVLDDAANEILGVKEALKCEYERQCVGDGGLTHLCTVASVSVGTTDTYVTVTVDDDADSGSVAAMCGPNTPTRYLRNGMIIDIYSSAHAAVSGATGQEIGTVVDETTFTIECGSNTAADTLAALMADGQLIYHADGYNKEFYGLDRIYGKTTGAFYNETDRSTVANSFLRPRVAYVSSAGKVVTGTPTGTSTDAWAPVNIHEFISFLVNIKKASKKDMLILCEEGIKAAYIQKKKAENSYFNENAKIDGWPYTVVEAEGVALTDANYMISNCMLFVPLNKHQKYLTREIDFRPTRDGSVWQPVFGYDAQESYLIGTLQMGSENIQQGGKLGDLKGQYDS
jgi:hypothetical protein